MAAALDGTVERPDGSNNAPPVTSWYGMIGAWCAMDVSYCLAHGGFSTDGGASCRVPGVVQTTRKGWAFVPYETDAFVAAGREVFDPQPGDIFVTRALGHTGLVRSRDVGPSAFRTWEGNYSNRHTSTVRSVAAHRFLRPPYDGSPTPTPGPTPSPTPTPAPGGGPDGNPFTPLTVDGDFGPVSTRALQWSLHHTGAYWVVVDGIFGRQTVRGLQARLNAVAGPVAIDGELGPQTVSAMQRHTGAGVDGSWGPDTTRHLQTSLNAGSF